MGRKRVSKGAIIVKKDVKLNDIADKMNIGFTDEDFYNTFKEVYPKDWARVLKRYGEHEILSKSKPHPMPEPDIYLKNACKKYIINKRKELDKTPEPTS